LTFTKQIEASTTTLNNLKSINEGIYINNKAIITVRIKEIGLHQLKAFFSVEKEYYWESNH